MTNDYGYTLDTGAAKSAETIGKYIRETGKYKGKFTRAMKARNAPCKSGRTPAPARLIPESTW